MYVYSVYHNKGFDWQVDYVTPTHLEARLFNYVHVHVCKSFASRILVRTLLHIKHLSPPAANDPWGYYCSRLGIVPFQASRILTDVI